MIPASEYAENDDSENVECEQLCPNSVYRANLYQAVKFLRRSGLGRRASTDEGNVHLCWEVALVEITAHMSSNGKIHSIHVRPFEGIRKF